MMMNISPFWFPFFSVVNESSEREDLPFSEFPKAQEWNENTVNRP